jgi:hypothetical protein
MRTGPQPPLAGYTRGQYASPDDTNTRPPQTHKVPVVKRWLVRNQRFHLHFTPTYSSWMNFVKRWFAALTDKALRATHRSVTNLNQAIKLYIEVNNEDPKPLVWMLGGAVALQGSSGEPSRQIRSLLRPLVFMWWRASCRCSICHRCNEFVLLPLYQVRTVDFS